MRETLGKTVGKTLAAAGVLGMVCFFGYILQLAAILSNRALAEPGPWVTALIFTGPMLVGISMLLSVFAPPDRSGKPRLLTAIGAAFTAAAGIFLWRASGELGAFTVLFLGGPVAYLLTLIIFPPAKQPGDQRRQG
ncbi:MAG: hypothetical protein R3F11_28165 [Verrucomicrobiales bacterium]